MKLLFDENISSKLVKYLIQDFPDSTHIDYLKMQGVTDTDIWSYAKKEGFTIISKDNDFRQRAFLYGSPPKVVWLSVGNGNTELIKELLLSKVSKIKSFIENDTEDLLVLELGKTLRGYI